MNYTIKLVYMDGKELTIALSEDKLGDFYETLSKKGIYWMEKSDNGFWTDLDKVRYVQIFKIKEEAPKPAITKVTEITSDAGLMVDDTVDEDDDDGEAI